MKELQTIIPPGSVWVHLGTSWSVHPGHSDPSSCVISVCLGTSVFLIQIKDKRMYEKLAWLIYFCNKIHSISAEWIFVNCQFVVYFINTIFLSRICYILVKKFWLPKNYTEIKDTKLVWPKLAICPWKWNHAIVQQKCLRMEFLNLNFEIHSTTYTMKGWGFLLHFPSQRYVWINVHGKIFVSIKIQDGRY